MFYTLKVGDAVTCRKCEGGARIFEILDYNIIVKCNCCGKFIVPKEELRLWL